MVLWLETYLTWSSQYYGNYLPENVNILINYKMCTMSKKLHIQKWFVFFKMKGSDNIIMAL